MSKKMIRSHQELDVYKMGFAAAMQIFEISKSFPHEERYSLTDQIRRSSRSVCANLAEAWRKRRYEKAFLLKLSGAEAEACETQTWLEFAVECQYIDPEQARELYREYNNILGKIVSMIANPKPWLMLKSQQKAKQVSP